MVNFKYIISGCPRSGTAFMANLFTQAGIPTGHECIYGMPGYGEWLSNMEAEASWLAAPYLRRDKNETKIIHIIRHPLKQISSQNHIHFFEDHNFRANIYTMYVKLFMPDIDRYRLMDRYMYFWINWNRLVETFCDYTYRLEDIIENPYEIFEDLKIDIKDKVLDLSKKNAYKRVKQLKLKDLEGRLFYNELIKEAKRYNYDLKSN